MSIEIMDGFTEEGKTEEQIRHEAQVEKDKLHTKTLVENKPFKDLLLGREELWEKCKDVLKSDIYDRIYFSSNDEFPTKEFLAGFKFCIELVEHKVVEYDAAFDKLGKE